MSAVDENYAAIINGSYATSGTIVLSHEVTHPSLTPVIIPSLPLPTNFLC